MTDHRTPVVLVAGWADTTAAAASLLDAGTVLVHHDLGLLAEGVVRRTVTESDGEMYQEVLELAHGCVSCTLRDDIVPLLRRLHARDSVCRIVLRLDPTLEPEAVCWAVEHVQVTGVVGQLDGPASRDVRIEAVVTCVDAASWLDDATGDDDLADRGLAATDDDERTVAQVVVGQVAHADALVVTGRGVDGWSQARLHGVLTRLAPSAPIDWIGDDLGPDARRVLARVPADARRGEVAGPHTPLLRGQPPLSSDCGVSLVEFTADRPFHPGRLHEALDVLLDGVVAARGRLWLATQPDHVLWLESAGAGLRVGQAGRWIAAMSADEQAGVDATRRALAALLWDDRHGDRHTSLVVLAHEADPDDIERALRSAVLTDAEFAHEQAWSHWPDPFGEWHADPCSDDRPEARHQPAQREDRA